MDTLARRGRQGARRDPPAELPAGTFPATIVSGLEIDSADFDAALDRGLELLDLDAFRSEQAARRAAGDTKQLGVGFSTYVEMCGLAPSRILGALKYGGGGWESMTVRLPADRHGAGRLGDVASRSGSRDDLLADRRRSARLRGRRGRVPPR